MDETSGLAVDSDKLSIAYDGPVIIAGRMRMLSLARGLRGFSQLAEKSIEIMYGPTAGIRVDTDAEFDPGSLAAPVYIIHDVSRVLYLFGSREISGLANLFTLLGLSATGGISLFRLFRRLNGRAITRVDQLPESSRGPIPTTQLIDLYNDPDIQLYLRRTLEPLRDEGVTKFETRVNRLPIDVVTSRELEAADAAEMAALTSEEEVLLDVQKAALKRSLAWHLSAGARPFDAKIDDENFWRLIENGMRFGDGDRLRVRLITTAKRQREGRLQVERRIPEVISIEHRRKPGVLFPDETDQDQK